MSEIIQEELTPGQWAYMIFTATYTPTNRVYFTLSNGVKSSSYEAFESVSTAPVFLPTDVVRVGGFIGQLGSLQIYSPAPQLIVPGKKFSRVPVVRAIRYMLAINM